MYVLVIEIQSNFRRVFLSYPFLFFLFFRTGKRKSAYLNFNLLIPFHVHLYTIFCIKIMREDQMRKN